MQRQCSLDPLEAHFLVVTGVRNEVNWADGANGEPYERANHQSVPAREDTPGLHGILDGHIPHHTYGHDDEDTHVHVDVIN